MAAETGKLVALFMCLWFVTVNNVDGEDVCEDKLMNCDDFDSATCQTSPLWAKETCPKFCGICDKAKQGPICPLGWDHFSADQTCIKVFGKYDVNKRHSWDDSRRHCQTFGGDLVQIRNEDKNSFVLDLLGGENKYLFLWIGLKNMALTGFIFKYVDGSDLGTYHPWLPNNPDNTEGREKCVCMRPKGYVSGQWNDFPCEYQLAYACSLPSNTTSGVF